MPVCPTALVTGARRGIGRSVAVRLAMLGFNLVVSDVEDDDQLQATLQLVEACGGRAIRRKLDVARLDKHVEFLQEAEAAIGPLTCLINNAGVSVLSRGDLLSVSPESFDRCLTVNTRGTFFLTQAFARLLLGKEGPTPYRSIITITSSNAHAVSISRGEYCISKAGLSMASKLFAARLANSGIGVFEVQPGLIATEMTAPAKAIYDQAIEAGLTATKRWGTPEDVAEVIGAMATGRLPYTVGLAVAVDGGLLMPRF
jgi:NAD(P)-dependent dehydrogenase (short-subunit alcohol dehydrogenase family)